LREALRRHRDPTETDKRGTNPGSARYPCLSRNSSPFRGNHTAAPPPSHESKLENGRIFAPVRNQSGERSVASNRTPTRKEQHEKNTVKHCVGGSSAL